MTSRDSARGAAVVALLATAPAFADPVEAEVGFSHLAFDLPNDTRDHTANALGLSLGAGAAITPRLHVLLRGHVAIADDASVASLGAHLRYFFKHRIFYGGGPAIVAVRGPSITPDDRSRGIGLAADLRGGIQLGNFTIAAIALPTYVFASDSPLYEAKLNAALEVGVSVGIQR